MSIEYTHCGFRVCGRGIQLPWLACEYRGYDRQFGVFHADFDVMRDDGSKRWRALGTILDNEPYFMRHHEAIDVRNLLRDEGCECEVVSVSARLDDPLIHQAARRLPRAVEAPITDVEELGYDAGWLLGSHSILFQPGFMTKASEADRQRWARRFNSTGLIRYERDACEFLREFYEQPEPYGGIMVVLAISLVK